MAMKLFESELVLNELKEIHKNLFHIVATMNSDGYSSIFAAAEDVEQEMHYLEDLIHSMET